MEYASSAPAAGFSGAAVHPRFSSAAGIARGNPNSTGLVGIDDAERKIDNSVEVRNIRRRCPRVKSTEEADFVSIDVAQSGQDALIE